MPIRPETGFRCQDCGCALVAYGHSTWCETCDAARDPGPRHMTDARADIPAEGFSEEHGGKEKEVDKCIIPEGAVFILTDGEYSSYEVVTICKASKDLNLPDLKEEFFSREKERGIKFESQRYLFAAWLVNHKRYAVELDYSEFYIGSYTTDEAEFSHITVKKALR